MKSKISKNRNPHYGSNYLNAFIPEHIADLSEKDGTETDSKIKEGLEGALPAFSISGSMFKRTCLKSWFDSIAKK